MQVIQQWCITEQKPQIKKNTTAVFHKTKTYKCKDTLAVIKNTYKYNNTGTFFHETKPRDATQSDATEVSHRKKHGDPTMF